MSLQQDLEALNAYWNPKENSVPLEVVKTAIDYKRLELSGNQNGSSPLGSLTPSLTRISDQVSGTIIAGAKFVSIFVETGTGSVLGATVSEGMEISFPYYGGQWGAITYAVDVNSSFLIQEGR